jgi:signal peptidase
LNRWLIYPKITREGAGFVSDIKYTTDKQIEQMRNELKKARERQENKKLITLDIPKYKAFKKIVSRITEIFLSLLIVILIFVLISVLMAKSKGETPSLLGYRLYIVKTGSMAPTLNIGTVILSREAKDAADLDLNTIITFKTKEGEVVTHRIIEIVPDEEGNIRYRTKGDNPLNSEDPDLLEPEDVIAVFVMKIPLT